MEESQVKSETSTVAVNLTPTSAEALHALQLRKKIFLLAIFTLAQFMDVAAVSMLLPAAPKMAVDLHLVGSESSWIFAAYGSTFAAFLLISGRSSDIYTPKPVFIGGTLLLGIMSLIAGFVHNKVGLLVLRALAGVGAAFTIPAAFNMVVKLFPDPQHRARAIGVFGMASAVGNVGGLLIGAVLVQFATWHWIFWLITLITVPVALGCIIVIPAQQPPLPVKGEKTKFARLDLVGVAILTVAVILFVFAVTQGANEDWGTAGVIAPLIISVLMVAVFLVWEKVVDETIASLPPKIWFYPNVAVLFGTSLMIYFWWGTVLFSYTSLWQAVYGYTTVDTAVRFLPLGVVAGFIPPIVFSIAGKVPAKRIILVCFALVFIATILLPFADRKDRYWSFDFPAFVIGTSGTMGLYIINSIAFFQTTPPEVAGIVGALFNVALQLGWALGLAICQSIQTSIDKKEPGKQHGYAGRAAGFWFLLAIVALEGIATLVFYKSAKVVKRDVEAPSTDEGASDIQDEKAPAAAVP